MSQRQVVFSMEFDSTSARPDSPITVAAPHSPAVVPYEDRLAASIRYVLDEGGRLFMGTSDVSQALDRITRRLDELSIPYAVVGGMALIAHGFRRFTEDIDLLVTADGLERIHEQLDGRGWVRPFAASKNLRDAETGVRIEFLVTGGYPGDGKPKPVSFPSPVEVAELREGIAYVNLPTFITLKLASGMTSPHRGKDLTDVEELIRTIPLGADYASQLHAYVRDKYLELWQRQQTPAERYLLAWNVPAMASAPQSLADVLAADPSSSLRELSAAGLSVDPQLSTPGQAILFTEDPQVAAKYGMVSQAEADLSRLRQLAHNRIDGPT